MALDYAFLDSGNGEKIERFGELVLIRPCSQAIWSPRLEQSVWRTADARFSRDGGRSSSGSDGRWELKRALPEQWQVRVASQLFLLKRTDFGHLGIFPEQAPFWQRIQRHAEKRSHLRLLNLFAYSGGASIAAALKSHAKVIHLDASKGMVNWAKENAFANQCTGEISWIVDDGLKFLRRRLRRKERFDAIIADPPTFGRGPQGELFKVERDLPLLLECCRDLLVEEPLFFLLSCHTPGLTPLVLKQMLQTTLQGHKGAVESGEMVLQGNRTYDLPSGAYAMWEAKEHG